MVSSQDTLVDLAPAFDLGYVEMVTANKDVDPWVPREQTSIVLPTEHVLPNARRAGIVVNLGDQRLYYFQGNGTIKSYPIGVGREGFSTPQGPTQVVSKKVDPVWRPTASARRDDSTLPAAVLPGPDNPLGRHALYLGWPQYLIHGTNNPLGVGRPVSRGCIRMYPEDIADLFEKVDVGTTVRVVNQPIKVGWRDGELYLEAHPTIDQAIQISEVGTMPAVPPPDIKNLVTSYAGSAADQIDWDAVQRILDERSGVPERITRNALRPHHPGPAPAVVSR